MDFRYIHIQAIIGIFMITAPVDPIKALLFNQVIKNTGKSRRKAALNLALMVLCILGGTAIIGKQVLGLIGINLSAFGFVGGLIVASMGFEMLYAGRSSSPQGGGPADKHIHQESEESGLLVPLAMPLIAGPGAMTTVITVSSTEHGFSALAGALLGIVIVALITFLTMNYLAEYLEKASRKTTQVFQRIGGLLLATIGAQLAMNSIRDFYGF